MWEPPDDADLEPAVRKRLLTLGARPWQVEMTLDVLVDVIAAPPPPDPELLPPIPPGDPLASE
jgi:ribonuclease D